MNINWPYWGMVLRRFLKAFVAGFFASLISYIIGNPLGDFGDWRPWLAALTIAGITGGLMALQKALQGWDPTK